jgi:pimeloyl-ACP methyl ester carboxylesterase
MVDMVVLFVHGMGRSPMSGWPMLQHLRRAGMTTTSFGYMTSTESFHSIQPRLVQRIVAVAATNNYIVIGHSLGGVLLRAALNSLPATAIRPHHVFLLGSPVHPPRLVVRSNKTNTH